MGPEVTTAMTLKPYRETLALPGIRSLLIVATLARIPITAGAVVLTLHVVTDLGRGYGAAGLVGAAFTIGASLGAPVMGRFVDVRGLRPMLVLTTIGEVAFWTTGQSMTSLKTALTSFSSTYPGPSNVSWGPSGASTMTYKVTYWLPDIGQTGAPGSQAALDDLQNTTLSTAFTWEAQNT